MSTNAFPPPRRDQDKPLPLRACLLPDPVLTLLEDLVIADWATRVQRYAEGAFPTYDFHAVRANVVISAGFDRPSGALAYDLSGSVIAGLGASRQVKTLKELREVVILDNADLGAWLLRQGAA
jgi:hypothetical protein